MKIGLKGIELIQLYEQCVLEAYMPTPNDVPTIGFGHTKGVAMGDTCTQKEADAWFLEDIEWVEKCVNKAITEQISQNEFDALCSLCFNIGCTNFGKSTLVKQLNEGDHEGAAEQFGRWNRQAGKVLAGLTKRRAKEAELFETA